MGALEQNIIKQCRQANMPLPDRIANAPVLRSDLVMYFNAFFDLDPSRAQGMELGRIPWHVITEYARYHEFSTEQADNLLYFVRQMDVAFLKYHKDKSNG